jgi:hypothetical protein
MPERENYEPGTPCWVDLSTPDVEAAIDLCGELFQWAPNTIVDRDSNDHIYTTFTKGGEPIAGLGGQPPGCEGAPGLWSTYIAVFDAAHTCEVIEKSGGQIVVAPMQVFEVGIMAVAADPTGVPFRIWQPLDHPGAGLVNEPNTWAWTELISSDVERAKQFYADVFGWTYNDAEIGHGTYWLVQGGEFGPIAGLMSRPPGMPDAAPDHWEVYFMVADIREKIDAVVGLGGQSLFGPETIPGVGEIATVMHPVGGVFSFMQPPG